jgi:hypothetical protein
MLFPVNDGRSPAIVNTISANGVLFWGLAIVQLGIERPIAAD